MHHRTSLQPRPAVPRRAPRRAVRAVFTIVLSATLVMGLTTPVLAGKKDDLERAERGVEGKIDAAREALGHTSVALTKATAALEAAQAKLSSAQATLGRTRGQLAVSQAEDARMQAELDRTQTRLDQAVADLRAGEKKLDQSEEDVAAFTVQTV